MDLFDILLHAETHSIPAESVEEAWLADQTTFQLALRNEVASVDLDHAPRRGYWDAELDRAKTRPQLLRLIGRLTRRLADYRSGAAGAYLGGSRDPHIPDILPRVLGRAKARLDGLG